MLEELRNHLGEKLDFSWEQSHSEKHDGWLVLLGHGVTGNKDRPIILDTAKALNQAGFDTLRFSFSGNGESEGNFTESTISKEVAELRAVVDQVEDRKIIYIGHSMGGAVGTIASSLDSRIKLLITLAGMVNTKAFAETEFGDVKPDEGFMWDEDDCPLSTAFMNDLCMTIQSVLPHAKNITCPWLLLHGTDDDVVLPQDSESIADSLGDQVTYIKIQGGDHSFNGDQRVELTKAINRWVNSIIS